MKNQFIALGGALFAAAVSVPLLPQLVMTDNIASAQTPQAPAPQAAAGEALTLFDFARSETTGRLLLNAPKNGGASMTLKPTDDRWDLSAFTRLQLEVANAGAQQMQIRVRAMNEGGSDWGGSAINTGCIPPRTRKTFNVYLYRSHELRQQYPELKQFVGMSGLPGGFMSHWHVINAADVRNLQIEIVGAPENSLQPQRLEIFKRVWSS